MNKMIIVLALLVCALWLLPANASAHVLMRDAAANIGAIVHINPDDDPVAGEVTQMYIDIQDSNASARIPLEAYDVFVISENGEKELIPSVIAGSVIQIEYTFKTKGLYTLEVLSKPAYDTFQKVTMSYALRVSRGSGASEAGNKTAWAEVVLPSSLAVIALVAIIGWNNKRELLAKSKL